MPWYFLSLRKQRHNFLSDEMLLVVTIGLVVGALGLWFIMR
jgi:hypothetical protein